MGQTQGDRIGALEEGYRGLGREIGGMREDFQTFARDMRAETTAMRNDAALRARTQWGPIISALSVAVAILGGLITLGAQGPLRDLNRHDEALAKLRTNRFTSDDGTELRSQLNADNKQLRDEMRLVVAPLIVRLEYIEKMAEKGERVLAADLSEIRKHLQKHVETDGHPVITEALRGLEKRLDNVEGEQRLRASKVYK